MNRVYKLGILMLALGGLLWQAGAFSLLGPYKTWQVPAIGYNRPGDIGGPMTPSERYRWNVPSITYAFDQSFINYFGSNGIAAVEEAIAILNNLPPASAITNDGANLYVNGDVVPREVLRRNYSLEAAGLLDVKSTALSLLLEELGLARAKRWVFALRGRATETINGVTFTNYAVVKLNYDPITLRPSSYVNGTLYSYVIRDPIRDPLGGDYADATEFSVDPTSFDVGAVAENPPPPGHFFIGLSHDDVGGLRFIYDPNNFANESLVTNVVGGSPLGGDNPWLPYLGATNATNIFLTGTNAFFNTNIFGSNLVVQGLRPGINKLFFDRVNYDSLLGQTFTSITNRYTDTYLSNAVFVSQPVERVLNQPDILFVSTDLGLIPPGLAPWLNARTGTGGWQNNATLNSNMPTNTLGGPGVIPPPVRIMFTDQLPVLLNQNPFFVDEASASVSAIWGSFDETTNAPIIYPQYGTLTLEDIQRLLMSGSNP